MAVASFPTSVPCGARLWAGVCAWAAAAAAGCVLLWRYETAPGAAGAAPAVWRAATRPSDAVDERPALIVALHPRCPCSAATVAEVGEIAARAGAGRVRVEVLLVRPAGAPADWEETALVRAARAVPGARVVSDPGGATAVRLGARTSGHAVLVGPGGRVLFAGGLTASRGHRGENAGRAAVLAAIAAGAAGRGAGGPEVDAAAGRGAVGPHCDVYGCPLFDDEAATSGGRRLPAGGVPR